MIQHLERKEGCKNFERQSTSAFKEQEQKKVFLGRARRNLVTNTKPDNLQRSYCVSI
jgi:hypothetical protein